ncbi:hypothetical protein F4680DRAFT_439660 [Xylaria scruposa]|nr:hypothetical protein F4680DRAFT_439660 [Xylaria scruposa]
MILVSLLHNILSNSFFVYQFYFINASAISFILILHFPLTLHSVAVFMMLLIAIAPKVLFGQ